MGETLQRAARDPLVARDLLIGVLAGLLFPYISWLVFWVLPQLLDVAPMLPSWWDGAGLALFGGRHLVGAAATALGKASTELFLPVMIVALMRLLLRKTWLAVGLLLPIMFLLFLPAEGSPVPHLIGMPLFIGLFFLVLFRVGFLASAASMCTFSLTLDMPITPDPSSWFFSSTVLTLAVIAALALYGFKIALPGRAAAR